MLQYDRFGAAPMPHKAVGEVSIELETIDLYEL